MNHWKYLLIKFIHRRPYNPHNQSPVKNLANISRMYL